MTKTKMKRFQIYLSEPQYAKFKYYAEYWGIPIAEYIRRVMDEHIDDVEKKALTTPGKRK